MRYLSLFAFSILGCLTLLSCQRSEVTTPVAPPSAASPPVAAAPPPAGAPFRVSTIDLGNALQAGDRITTPSSEFHPSDTIYASIVTDGASPSVSLTARWTYGDAQVVSESTRTIAPTGPAATEFHISKPDGWPTGHYKVEITANGVPAGSREFQVK
jgi:hypothetical protein